MTYNATRASATSFYLLEEASGSRADFKGTNALTATGSPGNTTGKFGSAAELNSTGKYLENSSADFHPGSSNFTLAGWFRMTTSPTTGQGIFLAGRYNSSGANERSFGIQIQHDSIPPNAGSYWRAFLSGNGTAVTIIGTGAFVSAATRSPTTWHHWALTRDGTTARLYIDGVLENSQSFSGSVFNSSESFRINGMGTSGNQAASIIADDVGFWNGTALSSGDIAQLIAGPEPISTVAPTLSGTQTEGQTLTSTTGTWDSQSNGTVTYSYQWTRSNDGSGAGEANIGGATSSTYTLVTADVGKFIRCRVRGSNDGGFDAAEDINSNFTGAIAAAPSPTDIIPLIQHHRQLMGAC